ncbi:MAG: MoxR family ATPase [Deltaproteobacteria bacterium]|nr:MoxR family ATPase [Deltaproteobacteria bacterium]
MPVSEAPSTVIRAEDAADLAERLRRELARRIVGQEDVVELLLIALLARGHGLFQGVPGLAKTLLIRSLAEATSCEFSRIQFTPDLMPADITGTEILEEDRATGRRTTRFMKGPLFANLVLADEINRTPPKTQAALLQAMQERKVSAAGRTFDLPPPFLVFATQNPVEQEGTYPLPEAQLDRFMFLVEVDYPSAEEEFLIVERTTASEMPTLEPQVTPEELVVLQAAVRNVPVGDESIRLAVELVRATRPGPDASATVQDYVAWGAGPRASQHLVLGAKARALLRGAPAVTRADIRALAHPVLAHRVLVNFRAESEGVTPRKVIDRLLTQVDPTSAL